MVGYLSNPTPRLADCPVASDLKRAWRRWRYLEARREAASSKRYVLYERALKALPGSYKVRQASLKRLQRVPLLPEAAAAAVARPCILEKG